MESRLKSRNANNYKGGTGILIVRSVAAAHCTGRPGLQHDVARESSKAQERAADDFSYRAARVAVVGCGIGGVGSAAGAGGGAGGGTGGRKGGRINRGSGGDGNGGSPLFNLVIDSGDERSQIGVLYVVGEDELDNSWDGAREVFRRGEVITLSIDDDSVPVVELRGEAGKTDCTHGLTCVVQNQRGEQARHIR